MSRLLARSSTQRRGSPAGLLPSVDANGGAEAGISSVEGVTSANASQSARPRRPYAWVVGVGLKV